MNGGGLQGRLLGRRRRRRRFSPIEGFLVDVRAGPVQIGMRRRRGRDALPGLRLRLCGGFLVLDEVVDALRDSIFLVQRAEFLLSRFDLVTVPLAKVVSRRGRTSRL